MILRIESRDGSQSFAFPISEDGIAVGYEASVSHKAQQGGRTHPASVIWDGSKVENLDVTVKLLADTPSDLDLAGDGWPYTPIRGGNGRSPCIVMLEIVQKLTEFALPPNLSVAMEKRQLRTVFVSIGGTLKSWYKQPAVLYRIKPHWKPPWDIETGLGHVCELELGFMIHYREFTGESEEYDSSNMPATPFAFNKGFK